MAKKPTEKDIKNKFLVIEAKSMPVGNFVKEWRTYRGLTQDQLAEQSSYTGSAISQLESGRSKYTQTFLEAIAQALDCHPADLLLKNPAPESFQQTVERLSNKIPLERRELFLAILKSFVEIDC